MNKLILIAAVAALFIYIGVNSPGAIILQSSDDTIYQYAGDLPYFKYARAYDGGRDNECKVDKAFYDAKIVASPSQTITIGSDTYKFDVSNVAQMKSLEPNYYSTCAGISYDVSVSKNGANIDSINIPNGYVEGCSQAASNQKVVKQYGQITATFGFDGEWHVGDANYCSGYKTYVINKYDINSASVSSGSSEANVIQGTPNNQVAVTSQHQSFFSRLWAWIKGVFI